MNPFHFVSSLRNGRLRPFLADILRVWPWLVLGAIATATIAHIAPQQIGVLLWSLTKLCIGAWLGYWLHRSLFPYARPHQLEGSAFAAALLSRAIVVAAVVIALGLGI